MQRQHPLVYFILSLEAAQKLRFREREILFLLPVSPSGVGSVY